jgi:flagellar biosynthesis protein
MSVEIVMKDKNIEENDKLKKTAVAVSYEPGEAAPKIVAAGRGEVAERIIEKAKDSDVPLYRDDKLAETLSHLEIGKNIPPELYEVIAEILVFVSDMDEMRAKLKSAGVDMTKQSKARKQV